MHMPEFSTRNRTGGTFEGQEEARGRSRELGHVNRNVARGIRQAITQRRTQANKLRSKALVFEDEGMEALAKQRRQEAATLEQEAKRLKERL